MKTLIVEDDFTSRLLLEKILEPYGPVRTAVNGKRAVMAVRAALDANDPYDLICLDIMMPEMDGNAVLKEVRGMEEARGVEVSDAAVVFMTTAVSDEENVVQALRGKCDAYLLKPIDARELVSQIYTFGLMD